MSNLIPVLSSNTSTVSTTSQTTQTPSTALTTTAASTSHVLVPQHTAPVALPLRPILHKIKRDLTILTCSYLTVANMFNMIVNRDSKRAFVGPQGVILAGYNHQLESNNGKYSPLTLKQCQLSSFLGHPDGPLPSARTIRNFDLVSDKVDDATLRNLVRYFPNLEILGIRGWPEISDEALDSLRGLRKLHTLRLSPSTLTDQSLSFLSQLTELKFLSLGCNSINEITDNTLFYLYELPLDHLGIQPCTFSDSAVAQYLEYPGNALQTLIYTPRSLTTDATLGSVGWHRENVLPTSTRWTRIPKKPTTPSPTNDPDALD